MVSGRNAAKSTPTRAFLPWANCWKLTAGWIISAASSGRALRRSAARCIPIPTFTSGQRPSALQSGERPELHAALDKIAKDVVAAQQPDGYLNTYFVGDHASERMASKTQVWGHELYNMGHFLQSATAYYRATGDRTLLDAGIRFVNNSLLPNFGPGPDKKPLYSGHPEMELALAELYRMTGDKRQLDLAGYLLAGDSRIHAQQPWDDVYHFCGTPFTSRTHLEGHAVRAMYACCGATDYYLETADPAYLQTLNLFSKDLATAQMYVTGGVGARSDREAFGA